MLLDPYLNQPYLPKLSYWFGCFSVYEREETLGEELNKYDPNDPVDRDFLIRLYCLRLLPRATFRHRRAEFDLLEQALADPNFDFASVWDDDEDDEDYDFWSWPGDWPKIANPRDFFQAIRDTAVEVWHEDLQRSNLPSLQNCREIPERDLGTYDWLFSVDNPQEWKNVFNLAVTPHDLKTQGPVFQNEGFTLSIEGPINTLIFRPSHWPPSTAFTYCELDASVSGISELEVRGSQFCGPLRGVLTQIKGGYYLRLEIGFDCVIECVALHIRLGKVIGSNRSK